MKWNVGSERLQNKEVSSKSLAFQEKLVRKHTENNSLMDYSLGPPDSPNSPSAPVSPKSIQSPMNSPKSPRSPKRTRTKGKEAKAKDKAKEDEQPEKEEGPPLNRKDLKCLITSISMPDKI